MVVEQIGKGRHWFVKIVGGKVSNFWRKARGEEIGVPVLKELGCKKK